MVNGDQDSLASKRNFSSMSPLKTEIFMGKFLNSKFSQVSSNSAPLRRLGISTGFHTNEDMESTKYFSGKNLHLISNYIYLPYCAKKIIYICLICSSAGLVSLQLQGNTQDHLQNPTASGCLHLTLKPFQASSCMGSCEFFPELEYQGNKISIFQSSQPHLKLNYSNYVKGWTFIFYFLQF